jgi:hypothetical protein
MLSWILYYDYICGYHIEEKAKHSIFPIKPNQPVIEPYYEYETGAYVVEHFKNNIVVLEFMGLEKYWDGGPLSEYDDYYCKIHNQDKVEG